MNLEKYVVVSGVSGVHKLAATRSNGILFEDVKQKRTRFAPTRGNNFTALATVSVYTETDEGAVPLADVFTKMNEQIETTPPVASKANSAEQRAYFKTVLPEHDEDQVHINDIKKIVKWFVFMKENGLLDEAIAAAEETPDEKEDA